MINYFFILFLFLGKFVICSHRPNPLTPNIYLNKFGKLSGDQKITYWSSHLIERLEISLKRLKYGKAGYGTLGKKVTSDCVFFPCLAFSLISHKFSLNFSKKKRKKNLKSDNRFPFLLFPNNFQRFVSHCFKKILKF